MKIGEIVEILIDIKKNQRVLSREEEAIIEACNLLDRLPRLAEATTYEPAKQFPWIFGEKKTEKENFRPENKK